MTRNNGANERSHSMLLDWFPYLERSFLKIPWHATL